MKPGIEDGVRLRDRIEVAVKVKYVVHIASSMQSNQNASSIINQIK